MARRGITVLLNPDGNTTHIHTMIPYAQAPNSNGRPSAQIGLLREKQGMSHTEGSEVGLACRPARNPAQGFFILFFKTICIRRNVSLTPPLCVRPPLRPRAVLIYGRRHGRSSCELSTALHRNGTGAGSSLRLQLFALLVLAIGGGTQAARVRATL